MEALAVRAAKTGDRAYLERAFSTGKANPATADSQGNTLLHLAVECQKNEIACIQLLLANGCSPSARNQLGATPLHYVALRRDNFTAIAELLLAAGANLDDATFAGHKPLHLACEKHRPEFVAFLLGKGAQVNALDMEQNTPLHMCIAEPGRDHVVKEIVEQLLRARAAITAKNREGNDALLLSAMKGYLKLGQFLIEHRADIRTRNSTGNTVLHEAAKHGHAELMEVLLTVPQLNINAVNGEEETALHLACRYNHADVAMLLLRRKAASNIPNREGQTPFDLVDNASKDIFDAKSQELDRLANSNCHVVAKMQGRDDDSDGSCLLM